MHREPVSVWRATLSVRAELRVVEAREIGSEAAEAALGFDEAFRRFAPYVARVGARILGRADDLDDLVQDVFLAAHRGLWQLRDAAAMKGWLATVTVRIARRKLRAAKIRAFFGLSRPVEIEEVVDPGATPEDRALLSAIYAVLERLPAEQRIAWTLHRVEGEGLERVAQMTDCSLATVKRRIAAAQAVLHATVNHA